MKTFQLEDKEKKMVCAALLEFGSMRRMTAEGKTPEEKDKARKVSEEYITLAERFK